MVTERKKYDNVREKACNNLDQLKLEEMGVIWH